MMSMCVVGTHTETEDSISPSELTVKEADTAVTVWPNE